MLIITVDKYTKYMISHVLGYQQSIWMSNVTKVACRWFQVKKEEVQISSVVNEIIKIILIFYLRKIFVTQKHVTSKTPANKTKTSKQKTTKATILRAQKLVRGKRLFILRVFFYLKSLLKKKNWNCLDNLIHYTTENMQFFNTAIIKLLLPIYQYSQDLIA